ncbi:MAG: UPF0147 family protein [archaeon]
MMDEQLTSIVLMLDNIKGDTTIPRNIRFRIDDTIHLLEKNCENCLKVSRVLAELEEITNDPNIPAYTRIEILNIVSILSNGE